MSIDWNKVLVRGQLALIYVGIIVTFNFVPLLLRSPGCSPSATGC